MRGDHHGQKPTTNRTQTGKQIRQFAEEDAEAEAAGEEDDGQEEMMQHPAWFLVVARLTIPGIGVAWLLAPSIPWLGELPGDIIAAIDGKPVATFEDIRRYVSPRPEVEIVLTVDRDGGTFGETAGR